MTTIAARYARVAGRLDERGRRAVAATEAVAIGRGGSTRVAAATGLARAVISRGIRELRGEAPVAAPGRVRLPGGGRKRSTTQDPTLRTDLAQLIDPVTRGDPGSPLRWTCKSLRGLAAELPARGHRVSHQTVAALLHEWQYSLQGTGKTREGAGHPDRGAQFTDINAAAATFLAAGDPVIRVDTEKKELVGDFANGGREWRPTGRPGAVRVHGFVLPEWGRVSPYGVDDRGRTGGWVNVGLDHDTATFAVESIRRWWIEAGRACCPLTRRLLIAADGGGSNGSRSRLWKVELRRFADETGLTIAGCHYPPGTSKRNTIEPRLFAFIGRNRRGRPLVGYAVILSLIAAATTTTGPRVESDLDPTPDPTGRTPTAADLATVPLDRHEFHGEWNSTIVPHQTSHDVVIV